MMSNTPSLPRSKGMKPRAPPPPSPPLPQPTHHGAAFKKGNHSDSIGGVIHQIEKINGDLVAERKSANDTIAKLRREKELLQIELAEARKLLVQMKERERLHIQVKWNGQPPEIHIPPTSANDVASFKRHFERTPGSLAYKTSSHLEELEKADRDMEVWKPKDSAFQRKSMELEKALREKNAEMQKLSQEMDATKRQLEHQKKSYEKTLRKMEDEIQDLRMKLDLEMKKNASGPAHVGSMAMAKLKGFFVDEKSGRLLDFDGFLKKVGSGSVDWGTNGQTEELMRTIRKLEEEQGESTREIRRLSDKVEKMTKDAKEMEKSLMTKQQELVEMRKTAEKMKIVWTQFQHFFVDDPSGNEGNGNVMGKDDNQNDWDWGEPNVKALDKEPDGWDEANVEEQRQDPDPDDWFVDEQPPVGESKPAPPVEDDEEW